MIIIIYLGEVIMVLWANLLILSQAQLVQRNTSQHGDKVDMPESEAQLAAPQKNKELLSNQVIKLKLGDVSRVHDELIESQHLIKALKEEGTCRQVGSQKDEHTRVAGVNHNLNNELKTDKEQKE
jgi:hypothetical protein